MHEVSWRYIPVTMSSYQKRAKSLRRTHRERGQPSSRKHLGLLEKHKDYVLRARNYQRKKAQLKILHEKARNRNPDEFYYKMVNTQLKDGRHVIPQPEEKHSREELHLMKTQDLKYVQMKLNMETKKIERLQANLHLLNDNDQEPPNKHTIFVDAEEVSSFDPAKHFNSAPELVGRTYNRSSLETLASEKIEGSVGTMKELNKQCAASYRELNQRIHRSRVLRQTVQKMKTKKDLLSSKRKCVKIPGDSTTPVTYRWKKERQK